VTEIRTDSMALRSWDHVNFRGEEEGGAIKRGKLGEGTANRRGNSTWRPL